jgi:hypothetical protein
MRLHVILLITMASLQAAEIEPGFNAQAIELATRLWRQGSKADLPPEQSQVDFVENGDGTITVASTTSSSKGPIEFTGLNSRAQGFIDGIGIKPAVQFSCVVHSSAYEEALERALLSEDPNLRLQALVALVRAQAPASVDEQWRTLRSLRARRDAPELLAEIEARFSESHLAEFLAQPAMDDFIWSQNPEYNELISRRNERHWCIRAAGATACLSMLDRLIELSRDENLGDSLAAEASLEQFDGEKGDQALVACLHGWRYNAAGRAGRALVSRNKNLLAMELKKDAAVPETYRYEQGLLLAACNDPAAVPILCATVGTMQIIDRTMFDEIARLAGPQHRDLIEGLPDRVRPAQRARAEAVRDKVIESLGASTASSTSSNTYENHICEGVDEAVDAPKTSPPPRPAASN